MLNRSDWNEYLLIDRISKIQSVIRKYGEGNFYLSFSGGKDSTVMSYLIDLAIPGNRIPRVYADTGIEMNSIRKFVMDLRETDPRITIIKPSVPIKKMLETEGYPFTSTEGSVIVFQNLNRRNSRCQGNETWCGRCRTAKYLRRIL